MAFKRVLVIVLAVILSLFPPTNKQTNPHPMPFWLPYYPLGHHAPCPLCQAMTIGGGLLLWILGTQQRHQRLSHNSADSVCLHARCHLHHVPSRPHTRSRTHTTPLHATTLHAHLLPAHTVPPHSHLYFGYKLPVLHVPLGLASVFAKDRATLHIHSTHSINSRKHPTPTRLGQVYKRALVVPPFSSYQRAFVCGAYAGTPQIGVSLVSLFDPLFQQSPRIW